MCILKSVVSTILVISLCLAPSGCFKKEQPKIRIAGSTTIHPFMIRVSQLYSGQGEVEIQVDSCGSLKGVEALLNGACDVAMCSSPIPADMLANAASKGMQIKGFSFAYDLIVPIGHPSNPINNLSLDQLAGIYQGTIDSWAAVGGNPGKIDVVARAPSSGTREVWNQVVLKSARGREDWVIRDSNSGVLAYVAEHPEAIGYVSLAIVNHEIKVLSVGGVAPTMGTAKARKYPVSRQLYLYVDEKTLSYPVKSLIVFVLSDKGQQIVTETGFIPQNALK
ncbi:MAG: phosphate ABC transporter substrate-binding protein [Deltaproteobacteria bacterium]|nr:phosphate ABC transporter substrate-binding protein [Deltaproteobacteria bacterium]